MTLHIVKIPPQAFQTSVIIARVRRSGVLTLFYSAPCRHKNLALLFVLVEENALSSVVSPGSLPGEFASGVF